MDDDRNQVAMALQEAIDAAGSQTALAALIGEEVKTGHIFYWLKRGFVPERHCPVIEKSTGVSRKRLCPWWERVWPDLVGAETEER